MLDIVWGSSGDRLGVFQLLVDACFVFVRLVQGPRGINLRTQTGGEERHRPLYTSVQPGAINNEASLFRFCVYSCCVWLVDCLF